MHVPFFVQQKHAVSTSSTGFDKSNTEQTKAVMYCRSSVDAFKLGWQQVVCHAYASVRNYHVVHEILDYESNADIDRPGLTELREFIRSGHVQVILMIDSSRLTCNHNDLTALQTEFASLGIRIEYTT